MIGLVKSISAMVATCSELTAVVVIVTGALQGPGIRCCCTDSEQNTG
jgi:hypothetical protein